MIARTVTGLWRSSRRRDWQPVEILGDHPSSGQLVLREIVDRFYRGVFLAPRDQVRLAGPEFEARQ
jgi:hypothetical protein